jgi:uncharacterized protein YbjQ (UPF0145 family)
MLLTTTDNLPDTSYTILGIVRGSTVQCKNLGHDFMNSLINLVGGEMDSYTDLMNEARDIATDRMIRAAENMGADAIVGVRYSSSEITAGAAEIMAYGTSVRFVK